MLDFISYVFRLTGDIPVEQTRTMQQLKFFGWQNPSKELHFYMHLKDWFGYIKSTTNKVSQRKLTGNITQL